MSQWVNDKSNKYNPYGGWRIPHGRNGEKSSYIQLTNFIPSQTLQKKIYSLSKQCSCCLRSSGNCVSVSHFHCTDCVHHTICDFCNCKFIPSTTSFLKVCQTCWKSAQIKISSDQELKTFLNHCLAKHCPCKFSKGNYKEFETDRDTGPVLA